MNTIEERIKAWSAPVLMTAILILASAFWKMQQDRIGVLEVETSAQSNTLATITENQRINTQDRADFQAATGVRLDRMQNTLQSVGESLAALTAIQKAQQHP